MFEPQAKGSAWSVRVEEGVYHMRVDSCPSGYILVRSPSRPVSDECSPCPPDTYSVDNASYESSFLVTEDSAFKQDAFKLCLPCPIGSECRGADKVIPLEGYWKGQEMDCKEESCDTSFGRSACKPKACYSKNVSVSHSERRDGGGGVCPQNECRTTIMIYRLV